MNFRLTSFPFIRYQRFFVTLSVILVSGSLFLTFYRGLHYGTDFTGGIKLQYRFTEALSEERLRSLLDPKLLGDALLGDFTIQRVGPDKENRFALKFQQKEGIAIEALSKRVQASFQQKGVSATLEQEDAVGPKAGKELRKKGQLSLIVACLLILIYIGYRFDFYFAPGAIIALIHDVLVTVGGLALTGREFTLTTVAALLTIIGYSVNDTIIIYDRVREDLKKHPKMPLPELVNLSINETLSRTIITSLTVFFVVTILYLFGEGEIEGFGFAMIIGVVAGSYSTIFVASPVYLFLKKWVPRLEVWWQARKQA
ncbi:MAG: protein translocase subunit SecF [Deltaproteobacteria bacterium]|nr:protein translocase subunit SecF [Deltaproteobacteria bacterium]